MLGFNANSELKVSDSWMGGSPLEGEEEGVAVGSQTA